MIASSATAGQPASPSRAETLALVHLRADGQPRLLGVLGDDAVERLDVLQRPAHQRAGRATQCPSSENTRTRAAESAIAPSSASRSPRQADGHRADRDDVDQPGLAAQPPHLLDDAGGVGDRVGVGHRVHRGEPAERRGPAAGLDRLGVLAAGLAQVGVQVDQARQRDQPGGVDDLGAGRGQRVRPIAAIRPSATQQVDGSPP